MASTLAFSKRLALSYIFDWIIIIIIAAVGAALSRISPNKRPFSLADPEISFPFTKQKISTGLLAVIGIIIPAIVVVIVCMIFVPGPTIDKRVPFSLKLRRKLWELNASLLGLALAVATAFFLTDAIKNLMGKPRPDLIARCNPLVNDIAKHIVGGYGNRVPDGTFLVSATICQNQGATLDEGFRSFPSGHSTFSWAGLTYLTLFLASKFAIAIPFLAPRAYNPDSSAITSAFPHHNSHDNGNSSAGESTGTFGTKDVPSNSASTLPASTNIPLRNQAAAPPTYLLVIAFAPIAAATYVSTTRYSDFRHHGSDILFGSILGAVVGWFAFRWYHLPVRQGAGWSWGPRSRDRAFGVGLGVDSYVGREGWSSAKPSSTQSDVEMAPGNGVTSTHAGTVANANANANTNTNTNNNNLGYVNGTTNTVGSVPYQAYLGNAQQNTV